MKTTEAMKIFKARHASYADAALDETDLLLLQQHYGELARLKIEEARRKRKKSKR